RDQFEDPKLVREFISDESSFDKLIEEYETLRKSSDAPFYDFNVTMQNHGGYAGTHGLIEEEIKVLQPEDPNDQLIQYMNLMKESDQAFEKLLGYFKKVKEPTLIVMFGDHQPGFTDSVYDALMGQDTDTLNTADTSRMYITPYIIWANYDLQEAAENADLPGSLGMDMSANYLSSYLLKLIGAPMTGYNKYLLDLMEKVPVISAICYIGDDGIIHTPEEESPYSELLLEYQTLQYNHVFDSENHPDDFFFLKNSDLTEWEFEHTSAPPS
ncbi:MAG: sulfatase-like hydrolase/transferase, partial [Dorea sp.]|nr:sulfatase-like hydrolase/transferase [Dorea sp.]